MSRQKNEKINHLLLNWQRGTVQTASALVRQGYSRQLLNRYKKSAWIKSIGTGALILNKDEVDYLGGIFALQQLGLHIHPGGKTALSLLKLSHYVIVDVRQADLFGGSSERLPTWFNEKNWGLDLHYHASHFLPPELGLDTFKHKLFTIKVSSPLRAILEMLYLAETDQDFIECYENLESLTSLHPKRVESLLSQCNSVKVKRLFLYMAEKAGHDWLSFVDRVKIDIGSGKRSLAKNGVYNAKYQITIPRQLNDYDRDFME